MQTINLEWSDDYLIGVEVIDEQHQRLFKYFAEVEEMLHSNSTDGLPELVEGLIDYSVEHNNFEETLMKKARYPDLNRHHETHNYFRDTVYGYKQRLATESDSLTLASEIRSYIGLWLIDHIRREDQLYAPYLQRNMDAGLIRSMLNRFFTR